MREAPKPENEERRIDALHAYDILDTLPEQVYDDITFLASRICEAPIAAVSLVDRDRQWFKSKVGLEAGETPRSVAFCAHAIVDPDEVLIVPDAREDERFAGNPLVTSEPNVRFYAGAPLRTDGGEALGTLCVIDREPRRLTEDQVQALAALSRQVMGQLNLRKAVAELSRQTADLREYQERLERYQRKLEETNEDLAEQSRTDGLTGLANRAALDLRLEEEFHRFRRHRRPLALLLMDVDHFKAFNDAFGHTAGDAVLQSVAHLLGKRSRASDLVARYGGEEFAVVLPGTDLEGAMVLAERFRRVVETFDWTQRPVTLSVGVAVISESTPDPGALVELADGALYEAKRQGRNRVVEASTAAA